MSELMIDIDDAMRAQQMKALWNKYGHWLVGTVAIVLLATIIGLVWHNRLNHRLTEQTNQLLTLLQDEAETPDTTQKLAQLHKDASFPLKSVVGLYRAQKLEQADNLKTAQEVYKEMVDQRRLSPMVRELASLHYVRLGILQGQKADQLLPVINPVADNGQAFRASAQELKGLLLRDSGKIAEANKIFTALSTNAEISATLRQRAKSLIQEEGPDVK